MQRKPSFHGLFMGIDRYASPEIQELRYAEQDAVALHTLLADNLGHGGELLIGSSATRPEIERRFQQLARVDPTMSSWCRSPGMAGETHELVTYNADLYDLSDSCILWTC